MNGSELQSTLSHLVRSRSDTNPAFDTLLHDYAEFHAVMVVLAGLVTLALVLLSVLCWRRSRGLAVLSAAVGLCMAVVAVANLSNALDPRHGLATAIPALGAPPPGTEKARVQRATNAWLRSGRREVPPLLRAKVDDRLSWQRPKAIICSLLLVAFVVLCVRIWRRPRKSRAASAAGGVAIACTFVLMVMAAANTQAAIAPLFLTVLYG